MSTDNPSPVRWLQLSVDCAPAAAEQIETLLELLGALSVTFADAADEPIFEPERGTTPLWQQTRVTGLFPAETDSTALLAAARDGTGHLDVQLRLEPMEERDWIRAWMADYRPMQFGRLCICPSGFETPAQADIVLKLDPGLAFGTGTHPTTRSCLNWLSDHPPGGTVIDYGCGSGVLALAAARLGGQVIACVDNDPQALLATADNFQRNDLAAPLTCLPDACPDSPADLLLANILLGPLAELAPRLATLVRPGGQIVLSGMLRRQQADLEAAFAPYFDALHCRYDDDWICLTGQRRAA